MNRRWQIFLPAPASLRSRYSATDPLLLQLLFNRGVTDLADFEPFLQADSRLVGDPFLLRDMEMAVERIYQAIKNREKVAIYGDYDADGVTGTAILNETLSLLGAQVEPYIPHRLEEGYGLNSGAISRLAKQGISLIITVDCGISAANEVKHAQSLGVDVIVTDHHSLPSVSPPALAVINPRQDVTYPFRDLAGVGVAFKLAQALLRSEHLPRHLVDTAELQEEELLDLVALGTVTDMAPLIGENRYFVKQGLETLNKTRRVGLQELIREAGLKLGQITSHAIGYSLGPRLNAAGRIDHAISSYRLLCSTSPEEARELASWLELKNRERQRILDEALIDARDQIGAMGADAPLLMVAGEYHGGIIGLVAGRLTEEFYRPTIVLEVGAETSRGSVRSIPEFNIIEALTGCQDLLLNFGGHAQAAGFSLPNSNILRFYKQLLAMAENQLKDIEPMAVLPIDLETELAGLDWNSRWLIDQLAPFGSANPEPTFLSRAVRVVDRRAVGSNESHLRLKLFDGRLTWPAIGFGMGQFLGQVSPYLDIVYSLEVDAWNGERRLQLHLKDFAPCKN